MKHSVEEITLKSGARGLFIDIPGASVMSTRVQFRAGMLYAKNKDVYEIPHLVEHLAFGENAKYRARETTPVYAAGLGAQRAKVLDREVDGLAIVARYAGVLKIAGGT